MVLMLNRVLIRSPAPHVRVECASEQEPYTLFMIHFIYPDDCPLSYLEPNPDRNASSSFIL